MATPKYDVEDVLDMILLVMTEGSALNTKVAAIEAEKIAQSKGLTPTLAPFADAAYHLQTWSDKVLNSSPAIFYGIEDVQSVSGGGNANAKTYKLFVEIVYVDNGLYNDGHKRINRYSRALEELFATAFDRAAGMGSVKIESVRPMAFKLELNSSNEIKVGGISISITLV